MGGRGSSSGKADNKAVGGISRDLQKHFDKENARVEQFMSGRAKPHSSIEMENGQILERYTTKQLIDYLKDAKNSGGLSADEQYAVLYSNGEIKVYNSEDDISKIKLSGIRGIINENESTSAYAGTGVKIENYNQIYVGEKWTRYGTNKDEDDWRMDFSQEYVDSLKKKAINKYQ